MEPLYRNILGRAWQITKKFKYLWLLGLFAAFLGNSTEYQILLDQINSVKNQATTISLWQEKLNLLIPRLDFTNDKIFFIVFILLISLAVTLLALWLVISCLGGLIKGAAEADKGQKYKVIGTAKHSETLEDLVIYEALYNNKVSRLWVRPKKMFLEKVEIKGKKVPRFKYLGE